MERVVTPREAAKALRMSHKSIYALLESGELDGWREGNYWKIPEKAVGKYINQKVKKERKWRCQAE